MRGVIALLCLHCAAFVHSASEGGRPRGVGPEFAKFYKDKGSFTCISDPSISVPFARVNDDYCDCPDGSDEPGTSACAHLSPLSPHSPADAVSTTVNGSLALPGFYCKNKGHQPSYLPFTRVNDGVCDYESCCDGSEEWDGVGGVKCEDRCQQIGKEWRKLDESRQKSLSNAARKRKDLVAEASKLRQQVQDRIQSLGAEIEGHEAKTKASELELAEVQRKERGKVVRGSVNPKAGKVGVLVGLARERMDELKQALGRVRSERDSSRQQLQELENILASFIEEYNPNFNDEGVKRAARAWEEYVARDKGPGASAADDRDLDELVKSDKDNGIDWEDYESGEDSDTAVLYSFEEYLPPSLRDWLDQKLRDLRVMLVENGILAASSNSNSGESKAVTDARSRFDAAKQALDDSRNDLASHKEDLEKDFGPDDVFRALKGQCVSTDSGEYTYEVCFLDKTMQKAKKGGQHTNMGNFAHLERVMVNDDLPPNGKGLGSGERIAMMHNNGQHCWNGPNRNTLVVLACSEENEIWKIMEEEKCVYRMEVGTPAVCDAYNGGGKKTPGRDEL